MLYEWHHDTWAAVKRQHRLHQGPLAHLQCRRDSYLSSSVSTVFPFSLCVSSSLQQPTTRIVLGHLHVSITLLLKA